MIYVHLYYILQLLITHSNTQDISTTLLSRFDFYILFHTADELVSLSGRNGDDAGRLQRRNRGLCGPGTATAAAVAPFRARDRRLRSGLRLRRRRPGTRRRGPCGPGHQQQVGPSATADRGRGLRAVRRVQAGPVRVRGRVVPAGGTAARVQPGFPAGAHGRAEGDGRRAVRHRAKDVRGRARRASGARPVSVLQLSADRPKMKRATEAFKNIYIYTNTILYIP